MNFRNKPRIKQATQQAASLSGVDDSVFTMNAAYRPTLETVAAHERTILQPSTIRRSPRLSIRPGHRPIAFAQHMCDIARRSPAGDDA